MQAFATRLFHDGGKARHDDHNLAVHEAAGFTGPAADRAAAVFTHVLGNASPPRPRPRTRPTAAAPPPYDTRRRGPVPRTADPACRSSPAVRA
ncbi:hypothetical protein [Streptomyces sp. NK15101]|uniref:hypothetical protein n=1 Tax=Streptomyces sp. NK15101 TaxID=2873261 RepID=UPI001CED7E84|nr:hypothetical protein [Streptomyces sp. NK15101]